MMVVVEYPFFLELLSFMENYSTSQQQPMEQQQQEHQHKSQLK